MLQGVSVSQTYERLEGFGLDARWGAFESEEALAQRMEAVLTTLSRRFPGESLLLCSHGGPCTRAYHRMLGEGRARKMNAGYTALYVFVRDGTRWDAPVAADQSHLTDAMRDAPDVVAADLAGPNDAAEQK